MTILADLAMDFVCYFRYYSLLVFLFNVLTKYWIYLWFKNNIWWFCLQCIYCLLYCLLTLIAYYKYYIYCLYVYIDLTFYVSCFMYDFTHNCACVVVYWLVLFVIFTIDFACFFWKLTLLVVSIDILTICLIICTARYSKYNRCLLF